MHQIIAAKDTLNQLLDLAASKGWNVDVLVGLTPPHRTPTGYYTAKELHVMVTRE